MKSVFVLASFSLFSWSATAKTQVICADAEKSVELTLMFTTASKTTPPNKLTLKSGGKAREVTATSIIRFVRNTTDFYVRFKVQTKSGLQEVELNTRINKGSAGKSRTSSGFLTNKNQPDSRLAVTCIAASNSF